MAVRRATYTFDDLGSFLDQYASTLSHGGLMLAPDAVDGELANQIRLDLIVPIVGRVGPITAQVVHRGPDGSVGLRLPDFEQEAGKQLKIVFDAVEVVKAYVLGAEDLVPRSALVELEERVTELEGALVEAEQMLVESAAEVVSAAAGAASAGPGGGEAEPAVPKGRGFPVPDVSHLQPVVSGSLSDRSFRDALVQLAVERVTGLMVVRYPDGRVRYGFWHRGGPVGFRTDPVQEGEVLGVLLFKARQITQEQLAESLEQMRTTGVRQGDALIDMGLISFPQLIMVLGKQVEFVLQRVMSDRAGDWSFFPLESLPEKFLPPALRVPSLLYRALVQRARDMPSDELAARHRPDLDHYVHVTEGVSAVLSEIKFTVNEAKFLEILQANAWRMRELFTVSPMSKMITAAVIFALQDLGFLEYRKEEDRSRYLARIATMVRRKKAQLLKATHFDVLEVHWISLKREIDIAHTRLLADLDPDAYDGLEDNVVADMKLLRARLEEAYVVLSSDFTRREYRKTIIELDIIVQSAELLAKKGEMAIMRQDRREACACYGKALELVPGRPDFKDGLRRSTVLG